MLRRRPVAVFHVGMKTRVSGTKVIRNTIVTVPNYLTLAREIFHSSLFKRDPRNVTFVVERRVVGVPVAVLHVVLKTCVSETKILGIVIQIVSNSLAVA